MTSPSTTSTEIGRDVISDLAQIVPGSAIADLRTQRPEATRHAQGSYQALFDPPRFDGLSAAERLAAALRVAERHEARSAVAHYRQRLIAAGGTPKSSSARLQAILAHADLLATRPLDARPEHLQALADAGLSTRAIVTLSQVIAFVSFQVRVVAALQLIAGRGSAEAPELADGSARASQAPEYERPESAARILRPDSALRRPTAFTIEQLEWAPWLEPLDLADATPQQAAALEGSRAGSPYFRLLAREVTVLVERTATDRGIFYTPGGAPRADRELAAAATSRLNGCIYCTSVHARLAAQLSKRTDEIDRLLRDGVAPGTNLDLNERWQGVVDLAVALAPTPVQARLEHVERLRQLGLSDLEILDVSQAAAFFAWANRLMLTLGEPHYAEPIG